MYEYSVRKEVLNSGEVIFTPLVRVKSKYIGKSWTRIVKIYDTYYDFDIDTNVRLTLDECQEHIKGFHNQFENTQLNKVKESSLIKIDI